MSGVKTRRGDFSELYGKTTTVVKPIYANRHLFFLFWPLSNCRQILLQLNTLETHTHSIRLLWTRDQSVAETSSWHLKTATRHSHVPAGFEHAIPEDALPLGFAAIESVRKEIKKTELNHYCKTPFKSVILIPRNYKCSLLQTRDKQLAHS
jgi:hypothetical protein